MNKLLHHIRQNARLKLIFSITLIVLSAFLQVYVVKVFIEPAHLISGGFTGIALFANNLAMRYGFSINVSLVVMLLNIPLAIFCYRTLSKRFVWLSILQFTLFSVILEFWNPQPIFQEMMLNILFGGLLWGFAGALPLYAGGSGGGTDFIAQYFGTKLHKNIFEYLFYFNVGLYILYGYLYGWVFAAYSIIFQFLATYMLGRTYKRYGYMTIEITCKDPHPVIQRFTEVAHHGISMIPITGGYSKDQYYILKSVVSADEVPEIILCLRELNPELIINTYRSQGFYGSFNLRPVDEI